MIDMNYRKLLAIAAILVIAVVPLIAADGSDADITRDGQATYSGFTDYDKGTLTIVLKNSEDTPVTVTVKALEFGNHDNVLDETTAEIPASSDGTEVKLSWGYGSDGTKYVDVYVYDADGNKIDKACEDCVAIDVTHSIWKNSVTYIVIVVVIIVIAIALILFIRTTKKTKADTTMEDKTFTKMHNEKMAKKSGTAEKKEYKSSGGRTRKSK